MTHLSAITPEDKTKSIEVLKSLTSSISEIVPYIKQLHKKYSECDMSKGVSFLDVKNHQTLSYLINLVHLMHQKTSGLSIKESPDVERLVEIRTVLEKMRPTEHKLKYQIDKLVLAASGKSTPSQGDPRSLRPNPENLVSKLGDEEDQEEEEGASGSDKEVSSKPKLYRPPKLVPLHYEGDATRQQMKEKAQEKTRKKIASSAVMRELREKYTDEPEEITDYVGHRARDDKKIRERTEYEENYFVRKSLTKKELHSERRTRMQGVSAFNDITKFPDFSAFGVESKNKTGEQGAKKRKSSGGKKKGSSKKRKFRH